jgi:N-acetylglucosamine-6-phosphate deacetylase
MSAPASCCTNLDLINARLPGYQGLQQIWVNAEGTIQAIGPMDRVGKHRPPESFEVFDLGGDWVSLGGVDLQINGALGLAFTDLSEDNRHLLPQICDFLWDSGIDGFLPTLVTTSIDKIQQSLAILAEFETESRDRPTAEILGVHLEGPFLNPEKRGAHPAEHLLPLNIDNIRRVLGDYTDLVRVVTLAPELDESGDSINYLRSLDIVVSLGHSLATDRQAWDAFDRGASMVTHAFNAMPGLHHRQPGLLGAAIVNPDVYCGLIADGQHVSPLTVDIFLRACQCSDATSAEELNIFLVSDALAPIGLPDGTYPWDTREIRVEGGTARLLDNTLAGTTLPLLDSVKNLVRWGICEIPQAIASATTVPRQAIGNIVPSQTIPIPGHQSRKVDRYIGQTAKLLRWHLDKSTRELSWQRLSRRTMQ